MKTFSMGGRTAILSDHIECARAPNGEVPGFPTYTCGELVRLMTLAVEPDAGIKIATLGDFFFGALVKKAGVASKDDTKQLQQHFYSLAPRLPDEVKDHIMKRVDACRAALAQSHMQASSLRMPKQRMVNFITKALAERDSAPVRVRKAAGKVVLANGAAPH